MKMTEELEHQFWNMQSLDKSIFWEAIFQAFKERMLKEMSAPKCPCCNDAGTGPTNSNFAGKPCPVCSAASAG